jgi:hypothetical protein
LRSFSSALDEYGPAQATIIAPDERAIGRCEAIRAAAELIDGPVPHFEKRRTEIRIEHARFVGEVGYSPGMNGRASGRWREPHVLHGQRSAPGCSQCGQNRDSFESSAIDRSAHRRCRADGRHEPAMTMALRTRTPEHLADRHQHLKLEFRGDPRESRSWP